MKKYLIKRSNQALEQLDEIITYVAEVLQATYAARDLLNDFERAMCSLESMPKRHQVMEDEPWHTEEIRRFMVDGYVVYYWINEDKNEVWVIAIVCQLRNQENVLNVVHIENGKLYYDNSIVCEH